MKEESKGRKKVLLWIADFIDKRTLLVFAGVVVITILAILFASRIQMTADYEAFLPKESKSRISMEQIREDFGSVEDIIVVLESDDLNSSKKVADSLASAFLARPDYFSRVYYKIPIDFFEKYGLLFLSEEDLRDLIKDTKENREDLVRYLSDVRLAPFFKHLNDDLEKEYVASGEIESADEEEIVSSMTAFRGLMGSLLKPLNTGKLLDSSEIKTAVDDFFVGGRKKEEERLESEYIVSKDGKLLLLFVRAAKTLTEEGEAYLTDLSRTLNEIITPMAKKFPDVSIRLTGGAIGEMDERTSMQQGVFLTVIISLVIILFLLIFSFRMWSTPILTAIPLMIGIVWSLGFVGLSLGHLNMFSAIFVVVIIGLAIDFGIHMITRYTEERARGATVALANRKVLSQTTQGILTGALTTAAAFLTLVVIEFKGFAEFGLVAGIGLILCFLCFTILMPLLFILKDRKFVKKERKIKPQEFPFLERLGQLVSKRPWWVFGSTLVLTGFLLFQGTRLGFETDLTKLEPDTESFRLRKTILERFEMSTDALYITAHNMDEMQALTDTLVELEDQGIVGEVHSLATFLPENQAEKLRLARDLGRLLEGIRIGTKGSGTSFTSQGVAEWQSEMERFRANLLEIADLSYIGGLDKAEAVCESLATITQELLETGKKNPERLPKILREYEEIFGSTMADRFKTFKKMTQSDTIVPEEIPESIRQEFVSKDGQSFLIRVHATGDMYDMDVASKFVAEMKEVDPNVSGLMVFMIEWMAIAGRSVKWAVLFAVIAIVVMLFIDFQSIGLTLSALIPIVFGAVWMLGIMKLVGMKLNMVSVMALPLLLGIGIDDGVHIIHRYLEEGVTRLHLVLRYTGKAVLLTTLTTMAAFGSMAFSKMPGWTFLGWTLIIGLGTCFLASVIVLPAVLKIFGKRGKS